MPHAVVKTAEQERLWNKAKALAEKEKHAKDWPYVMGIFKRMKGMEKSGLYFLEKEISGKLEKAFIVPAQYKHARTDGQTPNRDTIEALKLASTPAKPFTVARLLEDTNPHIRAATVFEGVGFHASKQSEYEKFLENELMSAPNELVLRKALLAKFKEDALDPVLRGVLLQRAISHYRNRFTKSLVQLIDPIEISGKKNSNTSNTLSKGEARGGKYYRRIPRGTGKGYRYIYDEQDYKSQPTAHLHGQEEHETYVSNRVLNAIQKGGPGGCEMSAIAPLVGKYGSSHISKILSKNCSSGEIVYRKGKLYHKSHATPSTPSSPKAKPTTKPNATSNPNSASAPAKGKGRGTTRVPPSAAVRAPVSAGATVRAYRGRGEGERVANKATRAMGYKNKLANRVADTDNKKTALAKKGMEPSCYYNNSKAKGSSKNIPENRFYILEKARGDIKPGHLWKERKRVGDHYEYKYEDDKAKPSTAKPSSLNDLTSVFSAIPVVPDISTSVPIGENVILKEAGISSKLEKRILHSEPGKETYKVYEAGKFFVEVYKDDSQEDHKFAVAATTKFSACVAKYMGQASPAVRIAVMPGAAKDFESNTNATYDLTHRWISIKTNEGHGSIYHEYAHFLDHCLGDSLTVGEVEPVLASAIPGSVVSKFTNKLMDFSAGPIGSIVKHANNLFAPKPGEGEAQAEQRDIVKKEMINYLFSPEEMFARFVDQWFYLQLAKDGKDPENYYNDAETHYILSGGFYTPEEMAKFSVDFQPVLEEIRKIDLGDAYKSFVIRG